MRSEKITLYIKGSRNTEVTAPDVTLGDILGCCDGLPTVGQFHRRAPRKGAQRHDDIVGRVDVNGERHGGSFSRGRAAQMKNEK